ncbi:hypothetical protein HKD37_03G007003 [Glycine soja]
MSMMVRTRGLGHASDRVIGRALWREDNRDSKDVAQQQRPTTSARRQREGVAVAEDAPHMDDAVEEVFQHAEEAGVDAQGFPGGSRDTLVLAAYVDHVAIIVWNRKIFIERPELKLSSHGRKVQKFERPAIEIERLVAATRLSHLITCSLDTVDIGFCGEERSPTLLHLPIIGTFHNFDTFHVDEAVLMLVELLEVSGDEARAKTIECYGAYACLFKCEVGHWTIAARSYLLHLLGCTLFANKSATHMHVVFLDAFLLDK